MNKRIRKKLYKRFGFFHYRDLESSISKVMKNHLCVTLLNCFKDNPLRQREVLKTLLSIPTGSNESQIPPTRTAWISSCGARYAGPCRINEMELAMVTRNKTLPAKYFAPVVPTRKELLDGFRLFTHQLHPIQWDTKAPYVTYADDPDMAVNQLMNPTIEEDIHAIAEDLKELSNKCKLDIPIRPPQQERTMGPIAEMVCRTLSHCFEDLLVHGKLVVNSVKQRDDPNEEEN